MGLSLSKDVVNNANNADVLPGDRRVYSFTDEDNLADHESTLRVENEDPSFPPYESAAASTCKGGLKNDSDVGHGSEHGDRLTFAAEWRLEKGRRAVDESIQRLMRGPETDDDKAYEGQDMEIDFDDEDGPHPPPVELDDGRSMDEVYGNVENFYKKLLKAAKCSYVRPNDNTWLSKLRFLTPFDQPKLLKDSPPANMILCGQQRRTPGAPPDLAVPCGNLRGYRSFTGSETKRLRLTDFNEITGCSHFVAVSYVWNNWPKEHENEEDGYKIIDSNGAERLSRASNRLIRWAIDYAAYWGLPFLWIDQECIDQSDRDEKQAHIDDIDRIFRRAAKVIAPLTTTIERCSQMKLAQRLLAFEARKPDQAPLNKDDVRDLGCRLFQDDWFSRAWTLQENISATLPYEIDMLVRPDRISHEGEFAVISLWMYQLVSCTGLSIDIAHRLLPLQWVLELEGVELEDIEPLHVEHEDGSEPDSNTRYRKKTSYIKPTRVLNGQQALKALHSKGIKLAEDRLGIMANMARYSIRIDLAKCKDEELDVGTCVFAQALLNGDMSLILAYRHYLDPCNKSDSLRWNLSQGSLSATLGLRKSISYTHGYAPHALEPNGIRVTGQLWKRHYCIDFGQLLTELGGISVPKPDFWCSSDRDGYAPEETEWYFTDFFKLASELDHQDSPVLKHLKARPRSLTEFILRELLQRDMHMEMEIVMTAMALAIGDVLLLDDPADFNVFRRSMPPDTALIRLFRWYGWQHISSVIDRLRHAKIEVYAPTQSNETYSGTIIFWNKTTRPAPAAIFTCRKVNDDSEPKYNPVIAWTLQSVQPTNGDELVLDDHLPREIHDTHETSPRYDPMRWYCKISMTWEHYGDNSALRGWEREYLLKWH